MRLFLFASLAAIASAQQCDRACLNGWVDKYLEAVVAHDAKRLPITANVKYTENGQRLNLDDGFWNTATAIGTYKLYVPDVRMGNAAFIGTMREAGAAVTVGLRLKVENGKIPEIETIVIRNPTAAANIEKSGSPRKALTESLPADKRVSRDKLVETANKYFTGMMLNDGKGDYPFADDCNRFENGGQSTNAPTPAGQSRPDPKTAKGYSAQWSCKEQFESGLLHFVSRIRDRRYVAVDEERGLVFALAFFDHDAGKSRNFKTPDGREVSAGPQRPWTWEIAEVFKVYDGKLHEIEAILQEVPYGMLSGWSNWEDGLSTRIR